MSPVFKAEALCLGSLLAGERRFNVPIFQRSYSWTAREVSQLMSDLWLGLVDSQIGQSGYGGLFLGSLVVVDRPQPPVGPDEALARPMPYEVIDGKQRLTTLTILLAALRDRLGAAAPWIEGMIAGIHAADRVSGQGSRLTLGIEEETYFSVQVRRPGATLLPVEPDGEDRGWINIRACQQTIVDDINDRSDEELVAFAQFLRDNVVLALISAPDIDSGFRIFLTTNHRGKPLSATDILKAELMSDVPETERDLYLERWRQSEKRLGEDFELVPGQLRAIHGRSYGPTISEVLTVSRQQGGAKRFLETVLFPIADAMDPILNATHSGSPQSSRINRTLCILNWLRARDWLPPALAFTSRYPNQAAAFAEFLEALERLAFGLQLLGLGGDRRVARYHDVIEVLAAGPSPDTANGPLALSHEEQGKIILNATCNLYQRSQTNCKLLLKRLSASYPGDVLMSSLSDVSVEHLLPRSLPIDSPWRLDIPNAEEREACCRLLGNMVLVTRQQNKDARNHVLATKQRLLFPEGQPSPHAITNQIMRAKIWRAADIRARDAELVQRMRDIWNLTGKPMHRKPKPGPAKSN